MTPPMLFKGLILDFGGVVSKTLFETHSDTERALGLPTNTLRWRGPFEPAGDALWRRMQAGEISERDYWRSRTREVGLLLGERWDDMQSFVQRARGDDPEAVLRPQTRSLIEDAHRSGLRLCILSNELDLFYGTGLRKRLPILNLFHCIVDATYTGVLKPDAKAYKLALSALGLSAAQCVFVDDQPRNIAGAARLSLASVHFDVCDPEGSVHAVRMRLGLDTV